MLAPLTFKLIKFSLNFAFWLHISPFKWNSKEKQITLANSRRDRLGWQFVRAMIWAHHIFVIIRCFQSRSSTNIHHVIQYIYAVMLVFSNMAQILMTLEAKR